MINLPRLKNNTREKIKGRLNILQDQTYSRFILAELTRAENETRVRQRLEKNNVFYLDPLDRVIDSLVIKL